MIQFNLFGSQMRIRNSFWVSALLCGGIAAIVESQIAAALALVLTVFVVIQMHAAGYAAVIRFLPEIEARMSLFLGGLHCAIESERPQEEHMFDHLKFCLGGIGASVLLLLGLTTTLMLVVPGAQPELIWRVLAGSELPEELLANCPPLAALTLSYMLRFSAFWTLIHVLPLFPLDGGVVLNYFLQSVRKVSIVGLVLTSLMAVGAMVLGWWLIACFMLVMTFFHYQRACMYTDEKVNTRMKR